MLNRVLNFFGRHLVSNEDYEWLQKYRYQYQQDNQEAAQDVTGYFHKDSRSGNVGVTEKWDVKESLKRLREERAADIKFFDIETEPVIVSDEESGREKHRVVPA